MTTRIQLRRDTAAQWASVNPTLTAGEHGVETDTGKFKIGAGAWNSLPYAGGGTPVQYNGPPATGVAATDTAAVQAFLNGVPTGARVVFPAGVYLISTAIQVPPRVTFCGESNNPTYGTVFKQADGANLDAVITPIAWWQVGGSPTGGEPTHFYDFAIDGNRANQSGGAGHGLVNMNYQSNIHRVTSIHTRGDAFRCTSITQAGSTITNSITTVYYWKCEARDFGGSGIHVTDTGSKLPDGLMESCDIDGGTIATSTGGHGVELETASGWVLDKMHIYAVGKDSIRAGRAFNFKVVSSYIEGWGLSSTAGTYCGINMESSPISDAALVNIVGNTIKAPSAAAQPAQATVLYGLGVQCASANVAATHVTIAGNTIKGTAKAAYGTPLTTDTTGLLIHNQHATQNIMYVAVNGNTIEGWDVRSTYGSANTLIVHEAANTGQTTHAAATFSATPAIIAAKVEGAGGIWSMTLTANITSMTVTTPRDGQKITIVFTQDSNGTRTVVWPTSFVNAPTVTTGNAAVTAASFVYVAATSKWVHIA